MQLLDLTLPTPAENVALDEALLLGSAHRAGGVLRLWEPERHFVVIGRGSQAEAEVDCAACRRQGVRVLRRCTGGCAIVAGPGCLMYCLVLSLHEYPHLRAVNAAHDFVMSRHAGALSSLETTVRRAGTSDLIYMDSESQLRKISGNSLRISREHVLYHGTLLYDFSLDLVSKLLTPPPREPEYRQHRVHSDFVGNLARTSADIRRALVTAWQVDSAGDDWPRALVAELLREKYSQDDWSIA